MNNKKNESFPKPTPSSQKLYRGAYSYIKNENVYSEEIFEVYKDRKENGLYFLSQIISRVSTGELLNINVTYHVNKDYTPIYVVITRSLGEESVKEIYDHNPRKGTMTYLFINEEDEIKKEFAVPPKFHITTPTVASSNIYLRSKKFDATTKNYYTFYSSTNQWEYEKEPYTTNVAVQKISSTSEKLIIDGQNVQGVEYRLFEDNNHSPEGKEAPPTSFIRIYLSPHLTLPYIVRGDDGTKVQIKFLNNLTEKDI